MRRLRPYLAVAVVAVALCADRAVQAAPMLRPEMGQLAERLVARLTVGFARSTTSLRILPQRQSQPALAHSSVSVASPRTLLPSQPLLSPSQFCLPPPSLS